jgi:hypothetical protein
LNSTIVIILIAIALLVLAIIAFLIIRRQHYVRALRGRGWTFESRPALEWVLYHHAPPFGIGFVRKVDEAVSGTTSSGVPFRVFEYVSA